MSSNLKVNSLVPATGTEIGIGTTGGSIDFRCPATFGGNVTIGGTLTYDEVINIDSIGIITARTGLNVSSGTATFAGAIDANGDLDVDGHTNLDNVNIAGVTTAAGSIVQTSGFTQLRSFTNPSSGAGMELGYDSANRGVIQVYDRDNSANRNLYIGGGNVGINQLNPQARLDVSGGFKVSGSIDCNGGIDVDGHTNLDNVSIAGVTTITANNVIGLNVENSSGSGAQTTIRSKSTVANASNFVRSESSDNKYIGLLKYGTGHSAYGALAAGGGAVYANSSVPITIMSDGGYINFATGGNTERLRITSSGAVGINTTVTAATKLQVQSDGTSTTAGGNIVARFQSNGSGRDATIQLSDNIANSATISMLSSALILKQSGTERVRIKSNGHTGIGTDDPLNRLHVRIQRGNSTGLTASAALDSGNNLYLPATRLENSGMSGNIEVGQLFLAGNTDQAQWLISCKKTGSNVGDFIFRTRTAATTSAERLRIKSDGDIEATGNLKTNNLSGRNMVINGDMRVAQRGTSSSMSSSGNDIPACDRWNYNRNGPSSTVAQVAEAPDASGFKYSLKWTNTSPVGSIAAGNALFFLYNIERQDIQRLGYGSSGAKTATLSFWAKGSLAGKIGMSCTRDSRIFSANVDMTANTWQYHTITISGDTSTGFSGNDWDNGFSFRFCWGAGSNATSGATNSWINFHNAYTAGFTAGQQGAYLTTNGSTFQITGVQLEIGSQSTPFEHRLLSEEIARCKRYYNKVYDVEGQSGEKPFLLGTYLNNSELACVVQFPKMRIVPSLDITNGTSKFMIRRSNVSDHFNTLTMRYGTTTTAELYTGSGVSGTQGECGIIRGAAADTYIAFNAEL